MNCQVTYREGSGCVLNYFSIPACAICKNRERSRNFQSGFPILRPSFDLGTFWKRRKVCYLTFARR